MALLFFQHCFQYCTDATVVVSCCCCFIWIPCAIYCAKDIEKAVDAVEKEYQKQKAEKYNDEDYLLPQQLMVKWIGAQNDSRVPVDAIVLLFGMRTPSCMGRKKKRPLWLKVLFWLKSDEVESLPLVREEFSTNGGFDLLGFVTNLRDTTEAEDEVTFVKGIVQDSPILWLQLSATDLTAAPQLFVHGEEGFELSSSVWLGYELVKKAYNGQHQCTAVNCIANQRRI